MWLLLKITIYTQKDSYLKQINIQNGNCKHTHTHIHKPKTYTKPMQKHTQNPTHRHYATVFKRSVLPLLSISSTLLGKHY